MISLTKRKGFSLIEVVACTLILAIVVIGTVSVSNKIGLMKTEARNEVQLSLHNLNIMERLRQMSYSLGEGEELLNYYSSDVFGSSTINSDVYIETAIWDDFRIYNIRIESRMKGYNQDLVSAYSMTNIVGYKKPSSMDDVYYPPLES